MISHVKYILRSRPPDFACPVTEICRVRVFPVLIQSTIRLLGNDDDGDDDGSDDGDDADMDG